MKIFSCEKKRQAASNHLNIFSHIFVIYDFDRENILVMEQFAQTSTI